MAELSYPWPDTSVPGPTVGDGRPYTDAEWRGAWRAEMLGADAAAGYVLLTGSGGDLPNRLACSTPGANQVTVAAGAALVDGVFYINDANADLAPASAGAGAIRYDRVVLRGSWGAGAEQYTARAYVKIGDHVTPPALTQVRNTTWEVSLCRYQIDEHGAVTNIVDERAYARYPTTVVEEMLATGAVTETKIGAGAVTVTKIGAGAVTDVKIGAGAVTELKVAASAINTAALIAGLLSADAAGRAKMADGYFINAVVAKFADALFAADAASRAKFADSIWTTAKLLDGILSADAAGRLKMADLFITTAKLDNDSVDDTKAGNRVPQFYRRQGGHADTWSTAGAVDRIPTAVRMQGGSFGWSGIAASSGSFDITYPVVFAFAPLVFLTGSSGDNVFAAVATAFVFTDTFRVYWKTISGANVTDVGVNWLAVGPE